MTEYTHITKVFYRPTLSNDFRWKVREFAVRKMNDTNKDVEVVFQSYEVSEKVINRKEIKTQLKAPTKKLKRGGFLGSMRNRVKLNRFVKAVKGMLHQS